MSRADIGYDYSTNLLTMTVPEWDNMANTVVDKTISYQFENISGNQAELVRYDNGQRNLVFESIYYNTADSDNNTQIIRCLPDNEEDPNFWVLNFQITTMVTDGMFVKKEYETRQRVPPLYDE